MKKFGIILTCLSICGLFASTANAHWPNTNSSPNSVQAALQQVIKTPNIDNILTNAYERCPECFQWRRENGTFYAAFLIHELKRSAGQLNDMAKRNSSNSYIVNHCNVLVKEINTVIAAIPNIHVLPLKDGRNTINIPVSMMAQ